MSVILEMSRTGLYAPSRRPKLGVYAPGTGTGGPWRSVHSLLAGLDLDEFEVVLFSDFAQAYVRRPAVQLDSPTSKRIDRASSSPPTALQRGPGLFRRLIPKAVRLWAGFGRQTQALVNRFRRTPVDLLHTHNTGCEESAVSARLAGVPAVVGTFHVDPTYDLHRERSGPSYRLLEYLSNHCLDTAIAVSAATGRDWSRRTHLPAHRVMTIHNGIDARKFCRHLDRAAARAALGLPADGLLVGGVGRLDEAKGFCHLLDAVSRLSPARPELFLVLAGRGPLRDELTSQATRLGIADRVRFLGFRADVQPVYDALDVFVLPSLCETLGYALLEAMATELPAVGTTVGGVPEVIVPGQTGFLVPPRDGAALAAALRPLLASEELRRGFGHAGRERVARHFREDEMVRRTIDVYRHLLRAPARKCGRAPLQRSYV